MKDISILINLIEFYTYKDIHASVNFCFSFKFSGISIKRINWDQG